MRQYMKDRYDRRRKEAVTLLGSRCVSCGATVGLEIDHVDPKTKKYNIGKILAGGSAAKVTAELAKCQQLCGSCHTAKSKIDNGVPHGGGASGKFLVVDGKRRGCPCSACREKCAAYLKAWHENKTSARS